ncbi:MAG: thioesterase domain-containing protein [Gracilimonas sp.]|nr:thioesterase domain-containing protein [Gracilimonas sp.]
METSHAFHSHMMDPVLEKYREFASTMDYKSPEIPIISTVRGNWASEEEVVSPDYWVENIRKPVRFAEAVEKLFSKSEWILLEVGPGNTLTTLAKQHPGISPEQVLLQSLRHPKLEENDNVFALNTFARMWSCGYPVKWDVLYKDNPVYKIPLPTYAFQRVRCWIDPVMNASEMAKSPNTVEAEGYAEQEGNSESKDLRSEMREIWQEFLGIEKIEDDDNFFDLGGNSLVAVQLFDELKYKLGVVLPLSSLFEAPTIKEITELIEPKISSESEVKKERSNVLVKIQGEGKGRPFFCIHGHFGNVLFFRELAMKLGKDRPFYGLQSVGLSGNEEPIISIDKMADRYISEMKAIQPEGPYHFGGYCYGAMVSRAMAQKLEEIEELYTPPIMIDPQPNAFRKVLNNTVTDAFRKVANNQRIEVHQSNLKDNNFSKKIGYLLKKSKDRSINIAKEKSLFALDELRKWIDIPMPSTLNEVDICNMMAHKRYSRNLERNFNSDVELILSKSLTAKFSKDPEKDWSGFTNGKVNVHLVEDDGVIMSGVMFDEPYVDGLANIIRAIWANEPKSSDSSTSKLPTPVVKQSKQAVAASV